MNKYVIYTAIVGNYDEIKQPLVADERFDYILFSDDVAEKRFGVWQIRPIPYSNSIQTKTARWVKTHPEILLADYKASLWIDANIQIVSRDFYDRFLSLCAEGALISTVTHPKLNCVYQEMLVMICARYEKESVVIDWGKVLRKDKYPRNNGLVETGLLYRCHSNDSVSDFDKFWWACIDNYSRRDQLSFNYALWKKQLSYVPFFKEGINVRNSSMVVYEEIHANESKKWVSWNSFEAWLGRAVLHQHSRENEIANLYYNIYGSSFPHVLAFVYGQYYRIKDIINRYLSRSN